MVGNLRGIRESGRIFAVPTYFFVCAIGVLLLAGLYKYVTGGIAPVDVPLPPNAGHAPLTTFLLLTAFANGCTAMTGVEAVSNGVPGVSSAGSEERVCDARDDGRAGHRHVRRHHGPCARLQRDSEHRRIGRFAIGSRDLRCRPRLLPDSGRRRR